ncbi:hypothetical protein M0811_10371 [Anaeramoeba ignava]|uniref:Uncharacterized protein n=1 Tax=Anaeramoeba ignava TaxID=1746090 RepID=A0A9Q0RA33_ANAIG|nr:hypothetical protein M0811_10371 [Anaeramoeba ignava]
MARCKKNSNKKPKKTPKVKSEKTIINSLLEMEREKPMNENTKDGRVEANIKNKRILKEDDENQLLELIRDDISAGESITPKQIGKLAKSLFSHLEKSLSIQVGFIDL